MEAWSFFNSMGRSSDHSLPLRTPGKHGVGVSVKQQFRWAQKHEVGSVHGDEGGSSLVQVRGGVGNGGLVSMTPRASRTVGRANSSYLESNSTQSTPTKSVSKPLSSGFRSRGVDGSVGGGARAGNFAALYKGMPISCGPATVVNSVEVPYFDLKEDPSFWMEHNVQPLDTKKTCIMKRYYTKKWWGMLYNMSHKSWKY